MWCFSSLARITLKGLGLKFPAYAPDSASASILYFLNSAAQSVAGIGGGGGEVFVRTRLGVADRVIGVLDGPASKGTGKLVKSRLVTSWRSSRSAGTKGGALGFPKGVGAAMVKSGVARF